MKMAFLFFFQVYKIDSRYFSVADGLKIGKGVTLGSVSTVLALTFLTRFMGYSRAVFVIDWMLAVIVLIVAKVFYRIFDELFSEIRNRERKKILVISGEKVHQSIRKYLQFRPDMNLAIEKYLSLTDFDFDVMIRSLAKSDQQIHLILLEKKTILSKEQWNQVREMGIDIVSESEFFKRILV